MLLSCTHNTVTQSSLRHFCLPARRDDRRRTNPRPYNTAFRVVVSGLPPTASWQDLKDHMRKGGEVTFAQVRRAWGSVLCW
jgi:hypothetical protein